MTDPGRERGDAGDSVASASVDEQHGVVFPLDDHGRRSTTAVGRAVVADALRPIDAAGARAAEQETGWRVTTWCTSGASSRRVSVPTRR